MVPFRCSFLRMALTVPWCAVSLVPLVVAAEVPSAAAAKQSRRVSAPECLPLNVGEVVVPTGATGVWTFAGTTPDCTMRSPWGTPGPVELRCYGTDGAGSFTMGHEFGGLDCTDFDEFIFFLNNRGDELTVTVTLNTTSGERKSATTPMAGDWDASWTELVVPLHGAMNGRPVLRLSKS